MFFEHEYLTIAKLFFQAKSYHWVKKLMITVM